GIPVLERHGGRGSATEAGACALEGGCAVVLAWRCVLAVRGRHQAWVGELAPRAYRVLPVLAVFEVEVPLHLKQLLLGFNVPLRCVLRTFRCTTGRCVRGDAANDGYSDSNP